MKKENKKIFFVEYKDQMDFGLGEEIEAVNESHAVRIVQNSLLKDGDYMSRLVDVYEITPEVAIHDDGPGDWKLKDGTVLDENDQELLNYAFENYVNEDGLTLDEAIKRASERKNNK